MKKTFLGLLFAAVVAASPASAAIITFSSSAAWQGAVSGVTTIDFEGLAAPGGFVSYGSPGSAVLGGVTFTTSTANLFVVDPAYDPAYDWGSGAVMSAQNSVPNTTTATLPSGVTGFGVDLMTYFYGGVLNITLSTGDTFAVGTLSYPNRAFFGVTSSVAISSVTFSSAESFYNIDNFAYSTAPAVPEPGTLLLLGSGLSALVLRRRRKA